MVKNWYKNSKVFDKREGAPPPLPHPPRRPASQAIGAVSPGCRPHLVFESRELDFCKYPPLAKSVDKQSLNYCKLN